MALHEFDPSNTFPTNRSFKSTVPSTTRSVSLWQAPPRRWCAACGKLRVCHLLDNGDQPFCADCRQHMKFTYLRPAWSNTFAITARTKPQDALATPRTTYKPTSKPAEPYRGKLFVDIQAERLAAKKRRAA